MDADRNMEIGWVTDEDVDDIVGLFSIVFGRPMTPQYYRWQFFREARGYSSVMMRVDGSIVSHAGYSSRHWMINGSKGSIMAKHTSMTHPDYRGRGLYGQVLEWSRNRFTESDVDLILSWPNSSSHPMQRNRSVYEDVYQIPAMKLSCPTPNASEPDRIPFPDAAGIDFHQWRLIAEATTAGSLFTNIRTPEYLAWRFGERPDTTYYAMENREGGKIVSAIIFKLYPSERPQVVNVVEWLCAPGCPDRGSLIDDLKDWAFPQGLSITIWHNVHDYPRHHVLERKGFVPSDPVFYFGAIPVGSQDRLGQYKDWRNWYMSMGDVDVF